MPVASPEGEPPVSAPDAFFAGVPRHRVVLFGVGFIVAGLLGFRFLPPLATEADGSPSRIAGLLVLVSLVTIGFAIVCLFKKPSAGSPPGSPEYDRLVAKQRADIYRSFMARGSLLVVLSALTVVMTVPLGIAALDQGSSQATVFFVLSALGLLGTVGFALWLNAARRGRLKHVQPPRE